MQKSQARLSLSAPLSADLKKKHSVGRMEVRKGDTVMVMRGGFRSVEGKVVKVDHKNGSLQIEGVTREKADGTTIPVLVHASKVALRQLVLEDKRRREILERRGKTRLMQEEKPKKERSRRRTKNQEGAEG